MHFTGILQTLLHRDSLGVILVLLLTKPGQRWKQFIYYKYKNTTKKALIR